jgi:hypothetical protein
MARERSDEAIQTGSCRSLVWIGSQGERAAFVRLPLAMTTAGLTMPTAAVIAKSGEALHSPSLAMPASARVIQPYAAFAFAPNRP